MIKLICQKNELLNGLSIVSKAVSSKTTLPILECILLETIDNKLYLMGNNLEIGIKSIVPANIKENGSVALDAKILSEIIRKLPEKEIEITVDSGYVTTIKCEKSEYTIMGNPGDEYPKPQEIEKDKAYTIEQNGLRELIRQTIFSVSMDESKPLLTGELIEIKNKFFNMVSVDGFRISFRKSWMESENEEIRVVIPGKTLGEVAKILGQEENSNVSMYFTDKHVLFDVDNSIIVSRLLEGDFLKYEQVFTQDYDLKLTVNKADLEMSIERAALISKDHKKEPIKLQIMSDKMIITCNTSLGKAYEELEIQSEGNNLTIGFNPKYLIDVLKAIEDEKVTIQFTSSLSPCIIKPIEGDHYKYLILPVRLSD